MANRNETCTTLYLNATGVERIHELYDMIDAKGIAVGFGYSFLNIDGFNQEEARQLVKDMGIEDCVEEIAGEESISRREIAE